MKRFALKMIAISASTVTLLVGCQNGSSPAPAKTAANGKDTASSTSSPPTTIKMMSQISGDAPQDDNPMVLALEKMTNTKLEFTWVPATAYNDKFNATLASGELPQVMLTNTGRAANVVNAVRAGAFWEIGPYLKQFPNLSKLDPKVVNNVSYDGKIYQLPRFRDAARHIIAYRKDWLKNLGLEEPKTLDDLYKVAKAFTDQDPDRNGKNDTVGFVEYSAMDALTRDISVYYGGPMNYGLVDDQVVPNFTTPEYFEGLKLYRKLFADKAMNQDFTLLTGPQQTDMMVKGKAGIIIAVDTTVKKIQTDGAKLDPKMEMGYIQGLPGPKGLRASSTGGSLGGFLFSKSSIKTEAELLKILDFFDKLSSPEAMTLVYHGIKDADYKMENELVVPNTELSAATKAGINSLGGLAVAPVSVGLPVKQDPLDELIQKMVVENGKIAVYDVASTLISPTKAEKGPELDKIKNDAQVKFIMGQIDEAGYKKAIEDWRKAGGDKIIAELTAEYKKMVK